MTEPAVRRLVLENALLRSSGERRVRPGASSAAVALLAEELGDRLEVAQGPERFSATVGTDSGLVGLDPYVRAWLATPAAIPLTERIQMPPNDPPPVETDDPPEPDPVTPRFLFPRLVEGVEDEELAATAVTFADGLEARLVEVQKRVREIQRDMREAARWPHLARVAVEEAETLTAAVEVTLGPLRRRVEEAEAELLSPAFRHRLPDGVDRADWLAAEAETRRIVRDLDPLETVDLYLRAAREGDRQTVRALELAPTAFPLVTEEQLQQGAELFAGAVEPEKMAALAQARRTRDAVQVSGNRALAELQRLTDRSTRPDPVRDQARASGEAA